MYVLLSALSGSQLLLNVLTLCNVFVIGNVVGLIVKIAGSKEYQSKQCPFLSDESLDCLSNQKVQSYGP